MTVIPFPKVVVASGLLEAFTPLQVSFEAKRGLSAPVAETTHEACFEVVSILLEDKELAGHVPELLEWLEDVKAHQHLFEYTPCSFRSKCQGSRRRAPRPLYVGTNKTHAAVSATLSADILNSYHAPSLKPQRPVVSASLSADILNSYHAPSPKPQRPVPQLELHQPKPQALQAKSTVEILESRVSEPAQVLESRLSLSDSEDESDAPAEQATPPQEPHIARIAAVLEETIATALESVRNEDLMSTMSYRRKLVKETLSCKALLDDPDARHYTDEDVREYVFEQFKHIVAKTRAQHSTFLRLARVNPLPKYVDSGRADVSGYVRKLVGGRHGVRRLSLESELQQDEEPKPESESEVVSDDFSQTAAATDTATKPTLSRTKTLLKRLKNVASKASLKGKRKPLEISGPFLVDYFDKPLPAPPGLPLKTSHPASRGRTDTVSTTGISTRTP